MTRLLINNNDLKERLIDAVGEIHSLAGQLEDTELEALALLLKIKCEKELFNVDKMIETDKQLLANRSDEDINIGLFEEIINKLYEKDEKLGQCFEDNFFFEKFENNMIFVKSYAKDEDRKLLYNNFKLIKEISKEFFGDAANFEFSKGDTDN